ncbi:Gp138 family membrane-puncturing spike protein [Lysinibacillus sp. BSL11]
MTKTTMTQFVSESIEENLMNMNTCLICEVVEVDMNLYKADVQPLNDPEATPILDVPFSFWQTEQFVIQVPFKKGDIVLVVCSQADIDPLMFGGGEAASRSFSANDALIVGGVNFFTKPLQNAHPDDVLITDKQFTNKIRIQPDGEIFIESDNKITAIAPTIHFNP